MAYTGKYIDRSPKICPAGINIYQKGESVQKTLNNLNTNYYSYAIKEPAPKKYVNRPIIGDQYAGFLTKMKKIIQPEEKSIFQSLLTEFKETRYKSYWNQRLGRCRDYIPGLPHTIDPETFCFGVKTTGDVTAGELINPKKTEEQVLQESEVGHELYKRTHCDYYPSEKINRKYEHPPINKDLVWGRSYPHSKSGRCVKCIMSWDTSKNIGEIQKKFEERNSAKLGKPFAPNKNIECVPKGFTFGNSTKNQQKLTAADLIRECSFSNEKRDILEAMEIINSLRIHLSKRSTSFPYQDMLATFRYRDNERSGHVNIETAYEILLLFNIKMKRSIFDFICNTMEIKTKEDNNLINYNALLQIICSNLEFPELKKIQDIPENELSYKSEYQDHYNDTIKEKGKKATKYNDSKLSRETDVRMLTSPSVYTQYGITYNDFFKVMNKTQIARLFKNIGIEIPNDKFETIWELASKHFEHGKVCLHTFTGVLKEVMPEVRIEF